MFQRQPSLHLSLAAELGRIRVSQVDLVLNAWRDDGEQLKFDVPRGQERPLLWVQPQWKLKDQDWKDHVKNLKLETRNKTHGRQLEKMQYSERRSQNFGDSRVMGCPQSIATGVGMKTFSYTHPQDLILFLDVLKACYILVQSHMFCLWSELMRILDSSYSVSFHIPPLW